MHPTCSVADCDSPAKVRGYCRIHYWRWYWHEKHPRGPSKPSLAERFHKRYAKDANGCWLWTGRIRSDGYADMWVNRHNVRAHRIAYELLVGPIPSGMTLDHLCRVRHCVNPLHLEAVTNAENVLRGDGITATNLRKTHCKYGHEFTPENTRYRRSHPNQRECRRCGTLARRRWRERRKAA